MNVPQMNPNNFIYQSNTCNNLFYTAKNKKGYSEFHVKCKYFTLYLIIETFSLN